MILRAHVARILSAMLALGVAPASAAPDREAPVAIAKRHFDQAEAYFKAGAYDLAAAEYQAAYDQVARPELLFDVGLAWENHGNLDAAIAAYDRFLAAVATGPKATEARARRDVLARKRDERAAAARAATEKAATEQAARLEADRARAERARADEAARARAERQAARERPSWIPAIAAYGAGTVALGIALGFGLEERSTSNAIENALAHGAPPIDSSDPRFDEGAAQARDADIALGIGAVATLVGVYFTYRVVSARRSTTVGVVPALGTGGTGAAIEVRW